MQCQYCGKQTNNPRFCCRSCASSYNNRLYPKRKRTQRYCKNCGLPVEGRHVVCKACNRNRVGWEQRTLGELQILRRYQVSSRIRELARDAYLKSSRPRVCHQCGYDKHIEVCHIKPIDSFPKDATVSEINALENLVALCPNCHWEFDNNLFYL